MQNKQKLHDQILDLVREYYALDAQAPTFEPGQRIPYASRVYDEREMVNLVDSALEFWLTAGRYTRQFERQFAEYLGVQFCSLVNSGSSANLLAFMALTSPLLGARAVRRYDIYVSTNLAEGFTFLQRVEGTEATVPLDGPAKFWTVLAAE